MQNITTTPNKIVNLTVKLTKSITGEALTNKEVEFFDHDSNYIGSNLTNSKGMAQFSYKVPSKKGEYTIDAHFNAEKLYACSDITAYFFIY